METLNNDRTDKTVRGDSPDSTPPPLPALQRTKPGINIHGGNNYYVHGNMEDLNWPGNTEGGNGWVGTGPSKRFMADQGGPSLM